MNPLFALPLALCLAAGPGEPPTTCDEAPGADRAWCATVASRPRLPLPSAADRSALREVYARPELRRARADVAGFRRLLAGLWLRMLDLLGSAEAERYASVGRTVFVLAVLSTAVAALAAARRRRGPGPDQTVAEGRALAPLPAPDRSAELAEAALARGDPTGAVRHAFLATLAALEDSGRLPRDRALTNRELATRIGGAAGELAGEFVALARTFDGAIYGQQPIAPTVARDAVATALRIRAALGGRA